MAVFKKQGVWWIDYYVNGRRKRERFGPDRRTAEVVLQKRKVTIAEGRHLDKQRPITTTFDELAEAYLKWISPDEAKGIPARKRSWASGDRYAIRQLLPYFTGKTLAEITPALVQQSQAHRRAARSRFGRPVKPATVNRSLAVLRAMFNVAQRGLLVLKGGIPAHNPVASKIVFTKERHARDRVLSAEELSAVWEAAPAWLQPIIIVAHDTGMRRGEIARLSWGQVGLKARVIKLTETKTDEPRLIPLSARVTRLLSTLPRQLSGPVFATRTGQPYHPTKISAAFHKTCDKVGLTDVVFHDLRHPFCTNMRRAGIDTVTIMAISGHRSLEVFRRYNTIAPQDLRRAITRLDTYLDTSAGQNDVSSGND